MAVGRTADRSTDGAAAGAADAAAVMPVFALASAPCPGRTTAKATETPAKSSADATAVISTVIAQKVTNESHERCLIFGFIFAPALPGI